MIIKAPAKMENETKYQIGQHVWHQGIGTERYEGVIKEVVPGEVETHYWINDRLLPESEIHMVNGYAILAYDREIYVCATRADCLSLWNRIGGSSDWHIEPTDQTVRKT